MDIRNPLYLLQNAVVVGTRIFQGFLRRLELFAGPTVEYLEEVGRGELFGVAGDDKLPRPTQSPDGVFGENL